VILPEVEPEVKPKLRQRGGKLNKLISTVIGSFN